MTEPTSNLGDLTSQPIADPDDRDRIATRTIWLYSLPHIGFGLVGLPFALYLMKFSTDVLLIAPAMMGVLFFAARLWDAFSDPMAGFLSDRTRSRHGRRRSWMFAAPIPIGIGVVMLWSPPLGLGSAWMVVWMAAALFIYETASTAFHIPHGALGVELSPNYHERTRIYGYGHLVRAVGLIGGMGIFWLLENADDPRGLAPPLFIGLAALLVVLLLRSTWGVPERADFQGRGSDHPFRALLDVARNPHARLLLIVYAVETFGTSSILLLMPYMTEYVLDLPGQTSRLIVLYLVPQFVLTPVWIQLGKRIEKKRMWLVAMVVMACAFFALFFIQDGTSILLYIVPPILGAAGGCGAVAAPSIKADIIDFDEYLTGQRKEGTYLAVWNLVRKSAAALPALFTGIVLQIADFQPNEVQSEETRFALRAIFGLSPAACYAFGAFVFARFRFNEREQAEIRIILEARRNAPDVGAV